MYREEERLEVLSRVEDERLQVLSRVDELKARLTELEQQLQEARQEVSLLPPLSPHILRHITSYSWT